MAAERLFALELLVDWVRLDGPLPPRAPAPAMAFRLLDFPPLLVRPPAAPVSPSRRGAIGFGRGKACVFRLRPAALRRPWLRAALLTLPPGPELDSNSDPDPDPAPRLLGACDIPLAGVAQGPGQGRRATVALRDPAGQRVGDVALFYRLSDLGDRRLGPAAGTQSSRPLAPEALEPLLEDANRSSGALNTPAAPEVWEEVVVCSEAGCDCAASAESSRTGSAVARSAASSGRPASPLSEDSPELDLEANTFCPPPLYYTHVTQEKSPPARVTITIEPQRNVPEELHGALPEKSGVNPPAGPSSPLKQTHSATLESPPLRVTPPHGQDIGAVNQTACPPPADRSTINTIRQLPLLNALLIELSLLYNQPVASPTHVHPHLAWLYRTEDKKAPESSTKSTCQSESKKDKLSVEDPPKSMSLQCEKNQAENLKKGKYFEKNSSSPPKRVTKGRLLYGLTNTLRLRLKQTNPDMLVVHERREQYRKMQAQPLGTKFRIPSSKVKVLSFVEQSQKAHQLPRDKYLDSDASFAENSDTSRQISGFFDEPSSTKETKLKCAADCGGNRTSDGFLEGIVSPANSFIPERLTHTNVSGGKLDRKVQYPCVFQQDAIDRTVHKEVDDRHAKATHNDLLPADRSESRPSKNSWYDSISELKYSDDFTSPCYSEDFYTPEDTSRSFRAPDSSAGAGSSTTSKSSGARVPVRKGGSEKSTVLSPPFSAGSPVLSQKISHISKTWDKSLEEASSSSTSNLSSSLWTEEKDNQVDQNSMRNSKATKRGHDCPMKLKSGTGCKCSEKSQSPQTSQVSSYLPSNLSEVELQVPEGGASGHLEEDDDVGSLRISKQCKDICELVINKLPGYTV